MAFLNGAEVIIIILIIVVLFFGARKIPELARSLGKASTEFQRAKYEAKNSFDSISHGAPAKASSTTVDREKLESIAETLGIDYSNKNDQDLRDAIDRELKKQDPQKQ